MGWKRPLFSLVAVVLFFALLEASLWAVGVSTLLAERDPFQGFSEQVRVFELEAERAVWRTAPRAAVHSFNHQEFLADKPADGYRVFVLGGSSAYGFPWGASVAFPALLGRALQASAPDRRVEVINAAAMSYGSHRLRILARELLEHGADALVVYSGHNEFVETRFYRDFLDRARRLDPLKRLLYGWRLYALAARARQRIASGPTTPLDAGERTTGELLGLDVVREYSVDVDDAERAAVAARFEDNLSAIVELARRAGVPVVLCTVGSNLSGWAPNQSVFGADTPFEDRGTVHSLLAEARKALDLVEAQRALGPLERAEKLAPAYAETHFLLGRALAATGRQAEALAAFVRARDLDGKPSRAPSVINEAIRRVGRARGALLVEVEQVFRQAAPAGPGFDLFEDYVHPKPEGHRLIARELWRTFLERGLLGAPRAVDDRVFAEAIGEGPAPTHAATTPPLLFNLAVVLENQNLVEQAMQKYRECLALDPSYYVARANLARLLRQRGQFEQAVAEDRLALEVRPDHVYSLVGLGESFRRLGRPERAVEVLERATAIDPRSAAAWDGLGAARFQQQRYADAETAFRRAAALDPEGAGVLANLGFALLFQQRIDAAESAFRDALARGPDHLQARNGLAAVLTERGELDAAEKLFRENLILAPDDGFARGGLELIARRRAGGG